MASLDATQVLPAPVWHDPRVHLLDDLWLLTIFAILLAVGLPWFVNSFAIEVAPVLFGLLALAGVHIAFTSLAQPARRPSPWRRPALALLHLGGVVLVGFVWQHAGGLQNPLFLGVFALPVIGAIFISRWQPYVVAVLAIVVVAAIALIQAPELRWYASGLSNIGASLAALFGRQDAEVGTPFPGFYAPTGYFVVMLEVFAVLLFACAAAAEYLGSVFERLHAHVAVARAEAERGHELWASLIENLPVPALLVDVNSLQVVSTSDAFTASPCASGEPALGRNLLEAIHPSYPEVLQELISGPGGSAEHVVLHVGEELRIAELHVRHIAQRGRRLALLVIEDSTETFGIRSALDVAEQAILVVDARDRVLAFNKPAAALFSDTRVGADATQLLAQAGAAPRWWEPGLSGRRKMHVRIMPRVFQVTSSALTLPGEEQQVCVIAFQPVARAEVTDRTGSAGSVQLAASTMVRPR